MTDEARALIEREIAKSQRHITEGTSFGGETAEWHEAVISGLRAAIAILDVTSRVSTPLSEGCTHEAWEEYGAGRRCADCRQYLDTPATPPTDEDEAVAQIIQDAEDGDLTKNGWSRKPGPAQRRAAVALRNAGLRRQAVSTPEPECEQCRWDIGFGAREPLGHTCGMAPTEDDFGFLAGEMNG